MDTTNFTYLQKYSAERVFEILQANKTERNNEFLHKMNKNQELKDVVSYICHIIVLFEKMERPKGSFSIENINEVNNCSIEGAAEEFTINIIKSARYYEDYDDPRNYPVLKTSKTISIDSKHITEFYLGELNKHIYQEYSHLIDVRHYIAYTDYLSLSDKITEMEAELASLKNTKEEIERIYTENNIDISIGKPRVLNKLIKGLGLSDKLERKADKLYDLYKKVLGTDKSKNI